MKHIVSRMSSYFPNRWPLSYHNLIKNLKTYIRRQQHKKKFKHQDIKQKEPPQKYRLGTISNTKLLADLSRENNPSLLHSFYLEIVLAIIISIINAVEMVFFSNTIAKKSYFFLQISVEA